MFLIKITIYVLIKKTTAWMITKSNFVILVHCGTVLHPKYHIHDIVEPLGQYMTPDCYYWWR